MQISPLTFCHNDDVQLNEFISCLSKREVNIFYTLWGKYWIFFSILSEFFFDWSNQVLFTQTNLIENFCTIRRYDCIFGKEIFE
jgi:hypothetical protein